MAWAWRDGFNFEGRGRATHWDFTRWHRYWPDECVIVLYSLARTRAWSYSSPSDVGRAFYESNGASVRTIDACVCVAWPDGKAFARWFCSHVFVHELGHHFVERYKHKNGGTATLRREEELADLRAQRLTRKLLAAPGLGVA